MRKNHSTPVIIVSCCANRKLASHISILIERVNSNRKNYLKFHQEVAKVFCGLLYLWLWCLHGSVVATV